MNTDADRRLAVRAIINALEAVELLKLGDGEHAFHLTRKKKGEVIDDPDCDGMYEALASGVFMRFVRQRGEERGFVWMHISPAIDDYLFEALAPKFDVIGDEAVRAIPFEAAFQATVKRGGARTL